ncbi:hypothetical protein B0J11DRAFT_483071 [Dendryphion nanum]|uniref:Uncharacterized protein n=1 Tax=Dendryphion nanum TaxID=256645 RepID=A0A9P9ITL0_9PLEO|nr:hypothetical protein B0J11DRAFT_483071 [Dendryphion nanum]
MVFLKNAANRLWEYVSPRKTQQRRNKDFKGKVAALPSPSIRRAGASDGATSSLSKVKTWSVETLNAVDTAVDMPPSPPTSLNHSFAELEGDTLINSEGNDEALLRTDADEKWDANEETVLIDEDRYQEHKAIDRKEERMRREAQGNDLRAAGWTEDAIFLFQKLGMRGFEPLMPYSWVEDFKSLPMDLFTRNMDKAFIKPAYDTLKSTVDFRAFKALEELFQLGSRVRDAVKQKVAIRTPEWHIRRAVIEYDRWAIKDGRVQNINLSLFEVLSADKGIRTEVMERNMRRRLEKSAAAWKKALRVREDQTYDVAEGPSESNIPKVPTLYGILVSHTIMAFISYDTATPDAPLRTIAIFDFGLEGFDVWNALAIAIFVIHCRNRMIELQDFLPYIEETAEISDPDL